MNESERCGNSPLIISSAVRVHGGEPLLGGFSLLCVEDVLRKYTERIIRRLWRSRSSADLGLPEGKGNPPVAVPARVIRLPDARPPQPPLPGPGHVRQRFSAGPAVEALRGVSPPTHIAAVAFLLREGPAQLPDRRAAPDRAAPAVEEPRVAGARSILPAAGRGRVRLSVAFRRPLLLLAFMPAQVSD